jgi:hypothetical protein
MMRIFFEMNYELIEESINLKFDIIHSCRVSL